MYIITIELDGLEAEELLTIKLSHPLRVKIANAFIKNNYLFIRQKLFQIIQEILMK